MFLLVAVVLPVLAGAGIYTLWRSKNLLVFTWYRWVGLSPWVMDLRREAARVRHIIPGVILYSLPDALWVYSFTALLGFIWSGQRSGIGRRLWIMLPLALGVGGEFGQLWHVVPGTFDWADLGAYFAAWFAALISVSAFLRMIRKQTVVGMQRHEFNA